MNNKSILTEVKKVLGIEEDYTAYDVDLILFINSAFATLNQLGVGPVETFTITDKTPTWSQFTTDKALASVKSYIWTSVRLNFDPPETSFGITALQDLKKELEWRLNVAGDRTHNAAR